MTMTHEDQFHTEAEEQVLGCVFIEPGLIKEIKLPADAFSNEHNKNLYLTFLDMDKKDIPIDAMTVAERVGFNNLHRVGGISGIGEIASGVVNTNNFEYYCHLVLERYKKKAVEMVGTQLAHGMDKEAAMKELRRLDELGRTVDDGDISEDLVEVYDDLEKADGTLKGSRTGYRDLDKMLGGLEGGTLMIVGARPSVGKTAFAINIGLHAAEGPENASGDLVDIFSYEMTRKKLIRRMLGAVGNIDLHLMKTAAKDFLPADWTKLTHAMGTVHKSKIKVVEAAGKGTADIRSHARKRREQNPDRRIIIIIDYLQLIQGDPRLAGNRQQQVSDISRELKLICLEFDVAIIALSQLSRGLEQRQDKRPMMADLRESGSIEQDADIIAFLYREDYYDKETEDQNMIEVIIAKNRDGGTGTVKLAFVKEYGKFVTVDWSNQID